MEQDHARSRNTSKGVGIAIAATVVGGILIATACDRNHTTEPAAPAQYMVATANMIANSWQSVPAVTSSEGALHISPLDMQIAAQDGSSDQQNPPINVDTHVHVPDAFSVQADMDMTPGASVRMYGELPVIQDEFRVERRSVEIAVESAGSIAVSVWSKTPSGNLANQQPIEKKQFQASGANVKVDLTDANGTVDISLNDKKVGTMPDNNTFSSHDVWFGVDAQQQPWKLSQLTVHGKQGRVAVVQSDDKHAERKEEGGLQKTAQATRPDFTIGAAVALYPLVSDQTYQQLVMSNFGQITLENASKWQFTEPQNGTFTFEQMDKLVNSVRAQGLKVNGHAAGAFGEALPKWVRQLPTNTPEQKAYVRDIMVRHIKAEVGHFKGRVAAWDIVNEPLADYDDFDLSSGKIYRDNIWYRAMGKDYIAIALRAAHDADPHAILTINDFGMENGGERLTAMETIWQDLRAQHVPVDAIGFESHVYDFSTDMIEPARLQSSIEHLGKLGAQVHISEMDVDDSQGQTAQAKQFADVAGVCIHQKACTSFTVWGVDDAYDMWQQDNHSLAYGHDLLWDEHGRPTPAVEKLRAALSR